MFGLSRILTVYAIAIPVALILGYTLSSPDQYTYVLVGSVIFALILPVFIRWHHILLIFFWNSAFDVFFLPAQPHFWLLLAVLSFGITWLNGLLGPARPLQVPELTRPLVFLGIVVFLTAYFRGGIGAKVFGSASYGGKSYFYLMGAIVGYFALSAIRIPSAKAGRIVGLYFASGASFALSNIAFALGPTFYFLFYLLPGEFATIQATAESGLQPGTIERFNGVTPACTAIICYLLVRYGIRGIVSLRHPWRALLFVIAIPLSTLGGFRSGIIMIGVLLVFQFFLEGLWRTRFLAIFGGLAVTAVIFLYVAADHMPLVAQRAVSFVPGIRVDPGVKADAEYSLQWRLEMWEYLLPEIPRYLLLGKGYAIDPTEMYFASLQGAPQEIAAQLSMVSGDYHSGPLSTIIPVGLPGTIAFLWLLGAGFKVLYRNYRYGDAALQSVNTFLLAYYSMQVFDYFTVFGAFNSQLFTFTGLLGVSVAINGGVRKRMPAPARIAEREPVVVQAVPVPV